MTPEDVRRIALELPGATEKSHFGKPDFRVRDRVFATLPEDGNAVVKLTRDQQEMMAGSEPAVFLPVNGGWGKQGWTRVMLATADAATLRSALLTAWRNTAPITLRKAFDLAAGDG
ncbi:MmcQ/YjbR family DNA-binding protein [Mesorhizobium sp. CC13]|uniref:MmcQ/YjbR family DNA-binding protein n=1 Tax=Mesorhizobium sp. CC13 TaxID=3029194 RepID=UPI0032664A09